MFWDSVPNGSLQWSTSFLMCVCVGFSYSFHYARGFTKISFSVVICSHLMTCFLLLKAFSVLSCSFCWFILIRLVVHNYSVHISLCPLSSRCRPRHSKGLRVSKILPTSGRSKTVRRSRQTSKFRAKRWKPVCNSSRWEDSCGLRDLENKEMQRALHGHYMISHDLHVSTWHTNPHLSTPISTPSKTCHCLDVSWRSWSTTWWYQQNQSCESFRRRRWTSSLLSVLWPGSRMDTAAAMCDTASLDGCKLHPNSMQILDSAHKWAYKVSANHR